MSFESTDWSIACSAAEEIKQGKLPLLAATFMEGALPIIQALLMTEYLHKLHSETEHAQA